ncbi:hypothetical protein [Streptomyces sp. MMS24-I29]|uniref:hypothetical protein n=1 Tax=Streptomyces sp. MMS24-I29 TaxID=3351480 RepID=UPI003C7E435F
MSVTVGELRKAIADLPDDYEVVLDDADVDDCEIAEVYIASQHPPALGTPGLLVLKSGQIISSEYHYGPRLDVSFEFPQPSWNTRTQTWG